TFCGSATLDPRTSRVVKLSDSDAWYLINRSYDKLKNEIDLIFRSHESASEFLAAVKTAGVKVGALRDVLPHFPSGGPFLSGHGFTSSEEQYQALNPLQRQRLDRYYTLKVEEARGKYTTFNV